MGDNKKAAIATCARAALSSLNKTGTDSLVTKLTEDNLGLICDSGNTAVLRRQNYACRWLAINEDGAGADLCLILEGRSVRSERDRVGSDVRISGGSPARSAPDMVNSTSDCVDNMARGQKSGAPHSLSAPEVKRGKTTAGEDGWPSEGVTGLQGNSSRQFRMTQRKARI